MSVPHHFDGVLKEVDKPGEGILIHGLHIGQSTDGKKEHRDMACHFLVAQTGLVNLQCSPGSLSRHCTGVQCKQHCNAACCPCWLRSHRLRQQHDGARKFLKYGTARQLTGQA